MNATTPLLPDSAAPRFSIIVPYDDGAAGDALLLRALASLAQQTFGNFEVLLFHDGPQSRPWPDLARLPLKIRLGSTAQRVHDCGHSLRELGIRHAHGDYLVHMNPDGVLYPHALETLDRAAREPATHADPLRRENPDVLVFAVLLRGVSYNGRAGGPDRGSNRPLIASGIPPDPHHLHVPQLVARRSIWLEIGGWYDRSEPADGIIYSAIVATRGARFVPEILGEHAYARSS